jgi:peptide/nickel transport system substrate-binding protein
MGRATATWFGLIMCALALAAPPQTARAQVLEAAVDASPAGLDPHLVTAFASFQVVYGTIYEGLTAIDKDLQIVPAVAESWTISPDGRTYRFQLRADAKFHDGAPVTAADAAASVKRVLSSAIASPLASRLAAVEAATAVDARTLQLTLKEQSATLLTALASIAVVPARFEADKDALQRQPMGSGPFKFVEWQPNNFIQLARHDGYWRQGQPSLAGIKFNIMPEAATRMVAIGSGQVAMLPNIDATTALQLRGRPNVRLLETLDLAYTLIGFNTSRAPFDKPEVREAANYAIDRAAIVRAALNGAGVAAGPLPPTLKDWALDVREFSCYRHDPARARALLRQAGVTQPLAVKMTVLPRADIRDIAQVVQQQLNAVGFQVELVTPELGQFVQAWRNSDFDMFASTNAGSVDPDDYFFRTFRSGGSTNVFKYANPEVDQLLDRARATVDKAARKADYDRVQRVLACQGPVSFLTYGQLFTALRANVQGFDMIANRSLGGLATTTLAR